jgi:hypothetical protein
MADISARFGADFSNFKTAVEQAEVTLKGFQDDAAKVGDSLDRMADRFSGVKVIQQAELMTKAIAEVGGASTLTDKEMAQVNATVTEAIEKYTLLGKEAPADMVALAKATEQTEESTEGFNVSVVAMGTAIGNMAAQAITALGRLAVEGFVKLVGAIDDFLLKGSEVADMQESFDTLTAAAGQTGETLLGVLAQGTHQTVDNMTLMKRVNTDLAAGMRLTEGQYKTLADGAFALAQVTGTDVTTALDTMSEAMIKGKTQAVEALVGTIDLERAQDDYARSLGTTRDRLTEEGKAEAARRAILEGVGAAVERLGAQQDGLGEKVAQAGVAWTNFTDKLSSTIATSPVLMAALDSLARSLSEAFGGNQQALIDTIADLVDELAIKIIDAGLVLLEWGKTGAQVFGALQGAGQIFADTFITVIERMTAGNAAIAELAAKVPGAGEAFQQVATDARAMADSWAATRAESAQTIEAARELMLGHSALHDVLNKGTEVLVNMKAGMEAASLATDKHTESTNAGTTASDGYAAATNHVVEATDAEKKAFAELNAVGKDFHETIARMNPEIVAQTRYFLEAGASASAIQTAYRLTAAEVAAVGEALKEEEKLAKEATKAHEEWAKRQLKATQDAGALWREYHELVVEMSGTATDRQIENIERWKGDQIAAHQAAGTYTEEVYTAIEAVAKAKLDAISVDWQKLNENSIRTLEQTRDKAATTYTEALAHSERYTAQYLTQLETQKNATQAAVDAMSTSYTQGFEAIGATATTTMATVTTTLDTARQAALSWSEAMDLVRQGKGTLGGTIETPWTPERKAETQRMWALGRYYGPVVGGTRENPLGTGPDWAALGATGRQAGGPVIGGRPYVVGERGPELFVPSTGGAVLPNAGGAMNVTINVNGSVLGNKQEIARVVGEALMASLRGAGMRLPVGA